MENSGSICSNSSCPAMPDFHRRPLEGFVTQLNLPSAQVHGYFPDYGVQRDGSIEPYAARGARQKEPLPIGVEGQLTQRGRFLDEALGRRLASEATVASAMIFFL